MRSTAISVVTMLMTDAKLTPDMRTALSLDEADISGGTTPVRMQVANDVEAGTGKDKVRVRAGAARCCPGESNVIVRSQKLNLSLLGTWSRAPCSVHSTLTAVCAHVCGAAQVTRRVRLPQEPFAGMWMTKFEYFVVWWQVCHARGPSAPCAHARADLPRVADHCVHHADGHAAVRDVVAGLGKVPAQPTSRCRHHGADLVSASVPERTPACARVLPDRRS
jgi:hypothetical protein